MDRQFLIKWDSYEIGPSKIAGVSGGKIVQKLFITVPVLYFSNSNIFRNQIFSVICADADFIEILESYVIFLVITEMSFSR